MRATDPIQLSLGIARAIHELQLRSTPIESQLSRAVAEYSRLVDSTQWLTSARISQIFEAQRQAELRISSMLRDANSAWTRISAQMEHMERVSRRISELTRPWEDFQAKLSAALGRVPAAQETLAQHLAGVYRASLAAESIATRIAQMHIGSALRLEEAYQATLNSQLTSMVSAYDDLCQRFCRGDRVVFDFPPVVSGYPPVECVTSVELADAVTAHEGADNSTSEELEITREIKEEIHSTFQDDLTSLDPQLLALWEGARSAISAGNADRKRHMAVSLRELLREVLHRLSPDELIKKWSSDPTHFEKGRPTRRARLLFICRDINEDTFSEFVHKDVEAALSFLDVFQQGTHQIVVPFTEQQLRAMLVRAESLVHFLVNIGRVTLS